MDLLQIHTGSTVADIGIIDRNGRGDDHGVNREVVIDEVKRAGFALAVDYDFVKPDGSDYFLIFRPSLTATEQHAGLESQGPLHERIQSRDLISMEAAIGLGI